MSRNYRSSGFSVYRPVTLESEEQIRSLTDPLEGDLPLEQFIPERFFRLVLLGKEATRSVTEAKANHILRRSPPSIQEPISLATRSLKMLDSDGDSFSTVALSLNDKREKFYSEAKALRKLTPESYPNPQPPAIILGRVARNTIELAELAEMLEDVPDIVQFEPAIYTPVSNVIDINSGRQKTVRY